MSRDWEVSAQVQLRVHLASPHPLVLQSKQYNGCSQHTHLPVHLSTTPFERCRYGCGLFSGRHYGTSSGVGYRASRDPLRHIECARPAIESLQSPGMNGNMLRMCKQADREPGGVYYQLCPSYALRRLHSVVMPTEFRFSSLSRREVSWLHNRDRWNKILEQAEYSEEIAAGSDVGGSCEHFCIRRCYGGIQGER